MPPPPLWPPPCAAGQNLQVAGTFAGLVALVLVLNLTPLPLWVEWIGFDRHTPASLLGEAYWDDCLGGPLGYFAARAAPRPGSLSYAPEAGASSPSWIRPPPEKKPQRRRGRRRRRGRGRCRRGRAGRGQCRSRRIAALPHFPALGR